MSPKKNTELNKNQLLGRERTLNRSIQSTQKKIDELGKKLSESKMELDEVQNLIKEEVWISEGKRIYIIRGFEYTKGKVLYRQKYRWFHLGRTDTLKVKSDEELKKIIRKKFYTSLIKKGVI